MKVAIIGYGWVGKAQKELFPDATVYIRNPLKYSVDELLNDNGMFTNMRAEINKCDVAFICVPTPNAIDTITEVDENNIPISVQLVNNGEGRLDTSIVEECIEWCECPLIVIRSTVNPGDCDRWMEKYHKEIMMQPEYLGETPSHPLLDTKKTDFLILGSRNRELGYRKEPSRRLIELYQTVYNANTKIRQVSLLEAEIIKLSENRAIAFKVAQCQELYDVCVKAGVDYYTIRDAVYGDDPRFNLWWTFVYPEKRGFQSKCIPKDIYAWCAFAESCGYAPDITRAILKKNKEWINQK